MKCYKCGADMNAEYTTDVTDIGTCLIIIRNVPCLRCSECDEIFYTGAVVKQLEKIVDKAKQVSTEITVIDYSKQVA